MSINWNEIITRAHTTALAHGWWDKPVSGACFLNNLHSEISEAWDEYAHNHEITEIYCRAAGCPYAHTCTVRCEDYSPQGVPVELADLCIRICDLLGHEGTIFKPRREHLGDKPFGEFILEAHVIVKNIYYTFNDMLEYVEFWCSAHSVPLAEALEQKMAYNERRPYRHGGKRV